MIEKIVLLIFVLVIAFSTGWFLRGIIENWVRMKVEEFEEEINKMDYYDGNVDE